MRWARSWAASPLTTRETDRKAHRTIGRRRAATPRTIDVPLTGADVPASVSRVKVKVEVAGRTFEQTYTPAPNLRHHFEWDGRDWSPPMGT